MQKAMKLFGMLLQDSKDQIIKMICVIAEELGRSLAPTPFSSSVYLATESILQLYQFYFQQYSQSLLLGLTSLNIFLVKSDLKIYG